MQDIAGCRIVVADVRQQDGCVAALTTLFQGCTVIDRRMSPSHGYRAVHVMVKLPAIVEVQVRTTLQHEWAEVSQKLADLHGNGIKYGGGSAALRDLLQALSKDVANVEDLEVRDWRDIPELVDEARAALVDALQNLLDASLKRKKQ